MIDILPQIAHNYIAQAALVGKQAHDALNSVSYDTSILSALIDYLLERTN